MSTNTLSLRKILSRLFELIRFDKKEIGNIYVLAILGGIIQLSLPLGVQSIISFVQAGEISTSLVILILLVVVGVLVAGYIIIIQKKIIEKIQQKIFIRYAYEFTEQLPKLDLKSIQSYYLPELINRFFETTSLQKSISKIFLDIPSATLQIFFGLILLSFYHPFFIFLSLLLILLVIAIISLTFKKAIETSLDESDYKYKLAAWIQELARVLKSFKYSRNTNYHLKKSDELTTGYLQSRTMHFNVLLIQYWSLIIFKVLITFTMLSVGAYLLVNQQLTVGQFIASEIIIITTLSSIEKLIATLENVYDAFTSIEKLLKITERPKEKQGEILFTSNAQSHVLYKINNMNFSFQENTNILNNINLEIQANEKVCIMGNDGAGKSVFLKILSGIYTATKGTVFVNNIPIQNYSLDSIRDKIGLLTNKQDVFEGTVLDNITLGNDISFDTIYATASQIGLVNFLQELPDGLDTKVQPFGNQLSTSAVEKIILLRLLVHEYEIMLMDEPWIRSESNIRTAVIEYLLQQKNQTIIVVSNDEAYASKADKIIYLNKNGEVDFTGKWDDFKKRYK
ncbi:MAG: ATP-binding cassette domain-containing protein [Sphingobacteriales bacterium]|nr:ATP-binding cassette domain-containing protein [Sphingobacteriales bacterium]